jgi:endoglucanase
MVRSGHNLALLTTAGLLWSGWASAADSDVRVSSIGYLPDRTKVGTITGGGSTFELRSTADNSVVLGGDLSGSQVEDSTGETVRLADFSSMTEPGQYYLEVPGVGRSVDFPISPEVYRDQLVTVMLGFFGWRSGMAVSFTHDGQTFQQGPGHLQDGLLDYLGQNGVQRDGSRGWYDAGDYGKYTVNTAVTLGMLLQAWEDFSPHIEPMTLQIPEQGGTFPDFLDEIKWQYDWLFTMQYSDTDGRVSHKLTSIDFADFVMPEDDLADTFYSPYGSAATAGFVAAMAKGSRVFRPYDGALADRMLTAAQLSYAWLRANTANHAADISDFNTGGYGTSDSDDRLWAAAEMWETTGDATALQDFETRANARDPKLDLEFDWGSVANLGMYAYVLSTRSGRNAGLVSEIEDAIIGRADELVGNRDASGYGRALTSYYWGINGVVARMCMTLQVANRIAADAGYLDTCADQVSYLYGRNTHDRSYVTGAGIDPPLYPHHRPSAADGVAPPFPGLLVGGPWPNAADWNDVEEDYETNEVAINWNGALAYALASFVPAAATGGTGGTGGTETGGTGGTGGTETGGSGGTETGGSGGTETGGSGGALATGGSGGAETGGSGGALATGGSGGAETGGSGGALATGGSAAGGSAGVAPAGGNTASTGGAGTTMAEESSGDDGGCGCRVGISTRAPASWLGALIAAAALLVRRRRN